MLHRSLDVLFQHAPRLLVILLVSPLVLGATGFALDHSRTVSARIWTDRPGSLSDFSPGSAAANRDPAAVEAALIGELLSTDSFADQVLADTRPRYRDASGATRASLRQDLRHRLRVEASGVNLVTVVYRTDSVAEGVRVLGTILKDYEKSSAAIVSERAAADQKALDAQVQSARADLQAATAAVHAYAAAHDGNAGALAEDPRYLNLAATAKAASGRYEQAQAASASNQTVQASAPEVRSALLHVADPPAPDPVVLTARSPAIRLALIGTVAALVLEALLVYVVARRDPRLRVGGEAAASLGLRYLGATTRIGAGRA